MIDREYASQYNIREYIQREVAFAVTAFCLKIIALISMFLDHLGLIIMPQFGFLRILGRLAFPLFAFFIAEGFRHTRNRKKYFFQIFILGLICQAAYFIAEGGMYLGVLLTFSVSLLLIAALEDIKRAFRSQGSFLGKSAFGMKPAAGFKDKFLSVLAFLVLVAAAAALCHLVQVDYGFAGVMLPVLAYITAKKLPRLILFGLGLVALCVEMAVLGGFEAQWWCFAVLPLLWLYNGEPGKYRMKYFFYLFYPAHLAVLYLISALI